MFMYHPDTENMHIDALYNDGWRGSKACTPSEVADIVHRYVNSPCLWAFGKRSAVNFLYAEWIGLDFDEGMPLHKALETFRSHMHVIGTTKSHQKPKKGVICDRFRVFLRTQEVIKDGEDYRYTAYKWSEAYGADINCAEPARKFRPCAEIVSVQCMGKVVEVVDSGPIIRAKKEAQAAQMQRARILYDNGAIPSDVKQVLKYGVTENRNCACFDVALKLSSQTSRSFDEILDMVQSSAIPTSTAAEPLSDKEVRGAVRRGFDTGRQNRGRK